MTTFPPSGRRSRPVGTSLGGSLCGLLLAGAVSVLPVRATGYFGPDEYLSPGGTNVTASPEFYWDLEVKRLAGEFHPSEKFLHASVSADSDPATGADLVEAQNQRTSEADDQDFANAIQTGRIKPPDPAAATKEQEAAREVIAATNDKTTTPLPGEFDSEFADYHRGAYAYRLGPAHWPEAQKAWEGLLNRPADERHYRSVWAAFMLGKLALKNGDPSAVKWFQMTRQLAGGGYADSLGMAADSYGWEGRSEWKQGHPEKAAPCFLNQLALGDQSAIVSLKALVPDRSPVDGMINYGPESEEVGAWTDEQKKVADDKTLIELKAAAADPWLRRLVTAHILATGTGNNSYVSASSTKAASERSARWLSVIKESNPSKVEDSEYLGWVAYTNGRYEDAAHWLELADPRSPAACWLRSKLLLRDGKIDDAVKSLSQALGTLRDPSAYTGWKPAAGDQPDERYIYGEDGDWTFPQAASGDLAQLHLARNDFIQALATFAQGGLWNDEAYIAERILTADELKAYVDQQPITPGLVHDSSKDLRNLLGRRLVREDRYAEAAAYLKPPYDQILKNYTQALKDGADQSLPKLDRAKAWFRAAWLARYDGLALMGTEVYPDGFDSDGEMEDTDLAGERLSGKYQTTGDDGNPVLHPMSLKPTKQEARRLEMNQIHPDIRYHYRLIAGALAVKAARLLDKDTAELADVVNTAGNWVKDSDEKAGDRIYQIMDSRCANTEIGRAAIAKHWFVDRSGPWSQAQRAEYDAMHQKLDDPPKAE